MISLDGESANGKETMTPLYRKSILVGSSLSILFGILGLAAEHVASGVLLVTLGFLTLISVLGRWRAERRGEQTASSFAIIKAYSFFGISGLCGVTLFVLAIIGVVREPAVYGSAGLILARMAAYVLVKSTIRRGR
jgi:hypothetical protein